MPCSESSITLSEADKSLVDELGRTFDEMFEDCDEELMNLEQEERDIELFLKKTFPEAVEALARFKKDPSESNLQDLESCVDVLTTQYNRIDHLSLTAENLVESLAKLMDKLNMFLEDIKNDVQESRAISSNER